MPKWFKSLCDHLSQCQYWNYGHGDDIATVEARSRKAVRVRHEAGGLNMGIFTRCELYAPLSNEWCAWGREAISLLWTSRTFEKIEHKPEWPREVPNENFSSLLPGTYPFDCDT